MPLHRRLSLTLPLALVLSVSGCDTLQRNDAPLPSFEQLRAAFAGQPPGQGLVREDDDNTYETSAVHFTTGEGELAEFRVRLEGEMGPHGRPGMTLLIRTAGENLQAGMQFESLGVSYGGPGCIGSGSGRIEITSVTDSLITGVFAADVSTTTLVPCHRRLTGGFTAVFDPPGE